MRDAVGRKKIPPFPVSKQPQEATDPVREEAALSQASLASLHQLNYLNATLPSHALLKSVFPHLGLCCPAPLLGASLHLKALHLLAPQ